MIQHWKHVCSILGHTPGALTHGMFKTFSAQIAGETGIDISEVGKDKGQVYEPLKELYNSIMFFGDDTQKGGNDYPFAKQLTGSPHRVFAVSDPQDTFEILESIKGLFDNESI